MPLGLTDPRWEWRTFGPDFAAADAEMRRRRLKRLVSREVLIVGGSPNVESRIRDRRLEIRQLLQTDDAGMTQWTPVVDVAFPIGAQLLTELFGLWQCAAPMLTRSTYCVDDLLGIIASSDSTLRAVDVTRTGYRCVIDDCAVESTRVVTSERVCAQTIAVEMIDPLRVMRVVAALGLTERTPLSFTAALSPAADVSVRATSSRPHPAERLRAIASAPADH